MNLSISRYERRDYIAELNRRSRWHFRLRMLGLAALAALLITYVAVRQPWPHASAASPDVSVAGVKHSHASFCRQAVLDHESWGRDLSPDLRTYCGL